MVQMFTDKQDERDLYNIFMVALEQVNIDIDAFFEYAYYSKELGNTLWDMQLVPVYSILNKELFTRTFGTILDAQEKCGSIESYIALIQAVYNGNAQIAFTMTPLHIKIDINAEYEDIRTWVTKDNHSTFVTADRLNWIVFKRIVVDLSNKQLRDLLIAMTNYGTYAEFTLNGEPL